MRCLFIIFADAEVQVKSIDTVLGLVFGGVLEGVSVKEREGQGGRAVIEMGVSEYRPNRVVQRIQCEIEQEKACLC